MKKGKIYANFEIKSESVSNPVISGYASVFSLADSDGDIIAKGAFKNSTHDKIKLLWQHEVSKPIGVIKKLHEDDYGLYVEAEINTTITSGREAAELIKQKALSGLSVGFVIKSYDYNQKQERIITDLELMEVSVVTFPSNKYAEIQQIKSKNISSYDKEIYKLDHLKICVKQLKKL